MKVKLLLPLLYALSAYGYAKSHVHSPHNRKTANRRTLDLTQHEHAKRAPAQPIRGVNLGGWLVTEPWITPGIYDDAGPGVIDEFTYGTKFGSVEASNRLRPHWDTWIVEDDIAQIAALGLNHIRVPIGIWAIENTGGEPYPTGQYPYLFKAAQWAGQHGIHMFIDLHGAPGSQNGFDNSGRRGDILWHTDPTNVQRTKEALARIMTDFNTPEFANIVTSIELLNEPAGFVGDAMMTVVRQFYYDGWGLIRFPIKGSDAQSNMIVSIHDAFQFLTTWNGFMPPDKFSKVLLDTHYYSIFTDGLVAMSDEKRIQVACNFVANMTIAGIPTYAGEWTPAPTDCARYLNGIGRGARYDGTFEGSTFVGSCNGKSGSAANFSSEYKTLLGKLYEVQISTFEKGAGWFAWTWKTQGGMAEEWSYQKGVQYGWIPRDPTTRRYGNQCN